MKNVRNVTPNNFEKIERLWAENGVVRVVTKDGKGTTLTVKEAAQRASALSQMDVPDWYKKKRNDLVDNIISVCRLAQNQQEDPRDKKTKALTNVLAGKSMEGGEVRETVDQLIQRFMFMFSTLTQREAEIVSSNRELDTVAKERLLKEIHRQRLLELGNDASVNVTAPVLKNTKNTE